MSNDGHLALGHKFLHIGMSHAGRDVPIDPADFVPGTYSRTSANSMPSPRKTLSYWPEKISLTKRRVLISRR